jgi:hypothetical protein
MRPLSWLVFFTLVLGIAAAQESAQPENDPHRPPCTSARCREIRSFLKAHYCGASPFANGPDDGCDTRVPKQLSKGIKAIADFDCRWNNTTGKAECQQHGEPSPEIRSVLLHEMGQLGLPSQAESELHFLAWRPSSSTWTLAAAYYERVEGDNLTLCQLIAVIEDSGRMQILRKVPFQKTDADVPDVTRWAPIDIADVEGSGQMEIILEGDAYENHWYEVDGIRNGSFKMIFSGLGYYL